MKLCFVGALRSNATDTGAALAASRVLDSATLSAAGPPPANDSPAPTSGVVLAPAPTRGRYLVIAQIGRGGMGQVSRAYDPRLQREVALKAVASEALSAEAHARLLREAQAMAKLSHPNVVAIYDVEAAGDEVVIAMEYVRGSTLATWLARTHRWQDIVTAFVAAGRGLAAAHTAGLLHRDFKPANVLVGDDGRVRVTDFGLAQVHRFSAPLDMSSSLTAAPTTMSLHFEQPDVIAGTPRYMAPEQHDAAELGPATDQYAFCVALWEALTRQRLFAADDLEQAAANKRRGPPAWPTSVTVPVALRQAIRRGLAPLPGDRWPTMQALLDALAQPLAPAKRWLPMGTALAVVGASTVALAAYRDHRAERCTGALAQLRGIWDEQRRDQVREALLATATSYARDVSQRVVPKLDAYASRWAETHTQACEASTIDDQQPLEVLDLRMACLHRARIDLRAVTDLLTRADAQVVEKAHQIVAGLRDLERCSDVAALQADVEPPAPADAAAVERIEQELSEVGALREAGKYSEMLARLQALADQASRIPYRPLQSGVSVQLGMAYEYVGDHATAIPILQEALRSSLRFEQWHEAALAATRLIRCIGGLQARGDEGLAYAETAQGLLRLANGSIAPEVHSAIGYSFETLGDNKQAEQEHRAAVKLAEQTLGADHLDVALYRGDLGRVLKYQGRLAEAEAEQRAGLAVVEAALGPAHPDVALARFEVANTLTRQSRLEEAEAEHRQVVAGWERSLGSQHPNTTVARQSLANALAGQGRWEEAIAEYQSALQVQLEVLGPDHAYVAITRASLGATLTSFGRYGEGEVHLRAALAGDERTYGSAHPDVQTKRCELAENLIHQQRYAEAETQARISVTSLQRLQGYEHPVLAQAHNALATALRGQGRAAEAELEQRRAVDVARRTWGEQHSYLAALRVGLGLTLEFQGRYEAAEEELRAALALQREALGPEHRHCAMTRARLAAVLRRQGQHEQAEVEYREALSRMQDASESDHPDIAEVQGGLGRTLIALRRAREALPLLEGAWEIWHDDANVAPSVRAQLAFALARALQATHGTTARARELARTARDLATRTAAHQGDLAEIERWLREHGEQPRRSHRR